MEILNGQIFEAPYPLCHTVIILYLGENDKWILLYHGDAASHNGSCLNVCHYERVDGGYNPIYTQKELQEKLKNWKLLNEKLILTKI